MRGLAQELPDDDRLHVLELQVIGVGLPPMPTGAWIIGVGAYSKEPDVGYMPPRRVSCETAQRLTVDEQTEYRMARPAHAKRLEITLLNEWIHVHTAVRCEEY